MVSSLLALLGGSLLLGSFATIVLAIFIAELTDKDALLLLTLATRLKPLTAFAAGSLAFTITTTIIVSVGFVLTQFVPVFWIKLVGGAIMIVYAFYQYLQKNDREKEEIANEEKKIVGGFTERRAAWKAFLSAVSMLIVLDLAGDATEVLTVVFVARYQDVLLVFVSCVVALVAASALETAIGNRLGKMLTIKRIKLLSLVVFLIIGSLVIVSTIFNFSF